MQKNNVGTDQLENDIQKAFDSHSGNRILAFKAIRRVGNYLDLRIGPSQVDLICAVWMWSDVMRKGGGIKRIINWTGYSAAWKKQLYRALGECLELELLSQVKVKSGMRIITTTKGMHVLKTYNTILEQVRLEELAKGLNRKDHPLKAVA